MAILIATLQVTSARRNGRDSEESREEKDSEEKMNRFDPVNFKASGLGLKTINSDFFEDYDVRKIETLDLSNNDITALESNTFVDFTSLTTLNLSNNKINEIALGWFKNLPLLSTLNLSNNKLTQLRTGVFNGLSLLTSLDLMSNMIAIKSIDNLPFIDLIKLTSLNLSNNKLVSYHILFYLH